MPRGGGGGQADSPRSEACTFRSTPPRHRIRDSHPRQMPRLAAPRHRCRTL